MNHLLSEGNRETKHLYICMLISIFMRIVFIYLVLGLFLVTTVFARDVSVPFVPNFNTGGSNINETNYINISTFNGTLADYALLNSSNGPFYDSLLFNSINTGLRILYNNAGNSLCTWSNALGTGFDCVTLSQNGNTVCDRSGNCNTTTYYPLTTNPYGYFNETNITNLQNNQILIYNSTQAKWQNKNLTNSSYGNYYCENATSIIIGAYRAC